MKLKILSCVFCFSILLFIPYQIHAEVYSDILLFPQSDTTNRWDLDDDSEIDNAEFVGGTDIFVTIEYKHLRFLGEYLLNTEEQELERAQLGWLFSDKTVWLGRFHNPIGYWNTQFHHGAYIENSISRPAIIEFEDDSGVVPIHLAGLLIEGVRSIGKQGLGYSIAFGAGPEYLGGLEPWDALSPRSGTRDISGTINLYIEPAIYSPTRYGAFVNYTEIPADGIVFTDIKQINSGFYGNWQIESWRLFGSAYYIYNDLQLRSGSKDDAFVSAYLQAEHNLNNNWTLFGRLEGTLSDDDDNYLALFPEFVKDRILGGVRFDFDKYNALKLEISRNHNNLNDDYIQFGVQWSASF